VAKIKRTAKSKPAAAAPQVERRDGSLIFAIALFLLIIGALAAAAYARNSIYRSHVSLWENVTTRSPNKRRAHENYGQALSTAGSVSADAASARKLYYEALRQFQMVMNLKDDGSVPLRDLYREVGVVYFRLGQFDEAITAWETGLRNAPNDPSLLNNLSVAFLQKGRVDDAARVAQTALTVDPYMPQALNTLGQAYMAKGDIEKAVQYFLKALEREPDIPARYWNAAIALDQAKKYDAALRYASAYASMERDPAARQKAAQFLEHLKKMTGK
jgi:tetratricopeptide (TPR) repeat protein